MPDGVTIIYKLDEPSMGESSFKGRLPPLGGSPVTSMLTGPFSPSRTVKCLQADGWSAWRQAVTDCHGALG
jgi:hypothetical protein